MARIAKPLILIFTILSLYGCNEPNDTSEDFVDNNSNQIIDNSSDTNQGLSGRIYFKSNDKYYELDLRSGITTKLFDLDQNGERLNIIATHRGEEFIARDLPRVNWTTYARFQTLDRQGQALSSFMLPVRGISQGDTRLSPDGSVMSFRWSPELGNYDMGVSLVSRTGDILDHFNERVIRIDGGYPTNNMYGYGWASNSAFFLAEGGTLSLVDYSGDKSVVKIANFEGFEIAGNIMISPDRSKIAFAMSELPYNYGTGRTHVYTLNIDGSGLKQITESVGDKFSEYLIDWTSDGENLLVLKTMPTSYDPDFWMEPCARIAYVVPADSDKVDLPSNTFTGKVRQIKSTNFREDQHVCKVFRPFYVAE